MAASNIEWTDVSWNPVTGCTRVSPGCAHCYAMAFAPRLRAMAQARGAGRWLNVRDGGKGSGPAFGVTLHPDVLAAPMRWKKPRRVFVNSMSDLFHEDVPFEFVDRVFTVMVEAEQHTFQVLTKRPERMLAYFEWTADQMGLALADLAAWPNIWLGVSIENRRFVGRADVLRETPAAVRFISAEPLLGPLVGDSTAIEMGTGRWVPAWSDGYDGPGLNLDRIDWLIVGGESGTSARRLDQSWACDLRQAAEQWGTAFFMKQLGGHRPGGALEDLPADLRIREFPAVAA